MSEVDGTVEKQRRYLALGYWRGAGGVVASPSRVLPLVTLNRRFGRVFKLRRGAPEPLEGQLPLLVVEPRDRREQWRAFDFVDVEIVNATKLANATIGHDARFVRVPANMNSPSGVHVLEPAP